ncbi:sn-glycerol-3-phosphate ABC transporter ATP-binding protein UgpC [Pelosinus sp. IPA-1]|uniref:ABC transporter ATP-binding protein n=1 Tax=Pelosinus sp. IPA-1 TaxID=3029569 RepID=UPI0024361FD7|nr:sn-glycerol-3-phosphate ABC transporter ATP-binding protein UgpC [Pelosinus sp. IPA-1]GMB01149.1 ABC transporter ATP-binding protein [Pelosinus sp. IPA-1]
MASVVLKNINKVYSGGNAVVKDCSIEIPDQEFLVLVGPSGCGKSTTLRMIAGLEEISSGEIYIDDRLVNDVQPKDRDIAMVFQNYALYPHMTVYENLAFALKIRKMPKDEIDGRVREAAAILGIESMLDRKPKALSGGQRQRVALGRAIVRQPKVFLMDEPLSNLDAKLRVHMRTELIKLHKKMQTTFIYVTHDQTEALTMGSRIVVMKDGVVLQVGSPQSIYDQPVNMFVASFIGSPQMNFINGRFVLENDQLYVYIGSYKLSIPHGMKKKIDPAYFNKEVVMGIRPENIYDELVFLENFPEHCVETKIDVVERMGSECYCYMLFNDQPIIGKFNTQMTGNIGDSMKIGFNMNKVHFFDQETQKRIIVE